MASGGFVSGTKNRKLLWIYFLEITRLPATLTMPASE